MADKSVMKRLVVLTLAELQKYPTLNHRFAATLPFNDSAVPCECPAPYDESTTARGECQGCEPSISFFSNKAKCIKRTEERWAWFSLARELDDKRGERLGTLGYLPWEIRQEIMTGLLNIYNRTGFVCGTGMARRTPNIFPSSERDASYGIRFASPSTQVEFEYTYLTKTDFLFDSPEVVGAFIDRLSVHQQNLLRSFTFEVSRLSKSCPEASNWMAICDRLPPNILSIYFRMDDQGVRCENLDGQFIFYEDCYYSFSTFHRAMEHLEIMVKRARRCAASAKISLSEEWSWSHKLYERADWSGDPDDIQPPAELVYVLDKPEPWSKTWLAWRKEAAKLDLDDGEEVNSVA